MKEKLVKLSSLKKIWKKWDWRKIDINFLEKISRIKNFNINELDKETRTDVILLSMVRYCAMHDKLKLTEKEMNEAIFEFQIDCCLEKLRRNGILENTYDETGKIISSKIVNLDKALYELLIAEHERKLEQKKRL